MREECVASTTHVPHLCHTLVAARLERWRQHGCAVQRVAGPHASILQHFIPHYPHALPHTYTHLGRCTSRSVVPTWGRCAACSRATYVNSPALHVTLPHTYPHTFPTLSPHLCRTLVAARLQRWRQHGRAVQRVAGPLVTALEHRPVARSAGEGCRHDLQCRLVEVNTAGKSSLSFPVYTPSMDTRAAVLSPSFNAQPSFPSTLP